MICIWCQTDYESLSIEHAIPEALGCPPDLVLDNIACTQCNNSLGKVDHALIKQFEILSVMLGVRRKGKRRPTIDSWSAISSAYRGGGHQIYLNGGPGTVEAIGKRLRPAKKSNGIEGTWVKPEEGCMGFSQQFGNDPLFLPSLYKVGLSLVAFHFGTEIASASAYDHLGPLLSLNTMHRFLTQQWTLMSIRQVVIACRDQSSKMVENTRCLNCNYLVSHFYWIWHLISRAFAT